MNKWEKRDKKRRKARYGMRVGSKSVLTIERLQRERAEKQKAKKK